MLQAVWNGNIIIIKSPKALGSRLAKVHLEDSGKDLKLTRKEFIAQVREAAICNVLRSFNTGIHSLGLLPHIFVIATCTNFPLAVWKLITQLMVAIYCISHRMSSLVHRSPPSFKFFRTQVCMWGRAYKERGLHHRNFCLEKF